jgi:5'-phosphate synthase pdxT subunit
MMRIGVLALQGAYIEHVKILKELGVDTVEVRLPEDLAGLDGLIIPGGESTTIGKLAVLYGLMDPLRELASKKPVWGTCAGMIFMSKDAGEDQPLLNLMDIRVKRNAFGRQVDSFEVDLNVADLNGSMTQAYPAVFIRAPSLTDFDAEAGVQVLARLNDGTPVAVRQGRWLATSFHPELTGDKRFHQYFLTLVDDKEESQKL